MPSARDFDVKMTLHGAAAQVLRAQLAQVHDGVPIFDLPHPWGRPAAMS